MEDKSSGLTANKFVCTLLRINVILTAESLDLRSEFPGYEHSPGLKCLMPQTVCRTYGSSLIGCSTAIESFQEALIKQRALSVWIVTLIPHMGANLSVCRNNYYHCLQYGIRIYTVCNNQFCHEKSANSVYCTRIFKFKKIYTVYIAVCRCITLTDINHYLGKQCNYLPDNYFLTLAAQQKKFIFLRGNQSENEKALLTN